MLQKKLEDTEHVLGELEERYRQANATIKEKEYLIANLLRSGINTFHGTIIFVLFLVSYGYKLCGKGAICTVFYLKINKYCLDFVSPLMDSRCKNPTE